MPVMMKISKKIKSPLEYGVMYICGYCVFTEFAATSPDSAALPRWRQPFTILEDVTL
jgi:hypothetical protein